MAVDDMASTRPTARAVASRGRAPGRRRRSPRRCRHLRPAEAEDGLAHRPQQGRAHLQPDQEQQDDHAEGAEAHDIFLLADQRQGEGADDGAGDQIAQHRAEPEPLGDRHRDHPGGEIDQGAIDEAAVLHQPTTWATPVRAATRAL
jgi:hypothetical protein